MKTCVLFDIDNTLVVSHNSASKFSTRYKGHLSMIYIKHISEYYYIINHRETAELFKYLLKNDVQIGFITAAGYKRRKWIKIFEKMYGLARNSLRNAVYINRYRYGDAWTPKGQKIRAAIEDNLIEDGMNIILVDDNYTHTCSAIYNGFYAVRATGFLDTGLQRPSINNSYLEDIKKLISNVL